MTLPRVSVIVVSYKSWGHLARCLGSLLEHTRTAALELIVVDNGSADGTVERLASQLPSAVVIANETNAGFGPACNQGMAAASGEVFLLLNSDAYVDDDVVGRAARHLLSRPEIGMLSCDVRSPDGRRHHVAQRRLSVRRSLFERLWLYKVIPPSRRDTFLMGGYYEGNAEVEVDWLAGAFLMLKPTVFRMSGGFDERFWMYGEDSEWGMRLRRTGVRVLYAPQLGTVHHVGAASSDLHWTVRERLGRGFVGGLEAYAAVHGRHRAKLFHAAELLGTTARWMVYRTAGAIRSSDYFRTQSEYYAWLARFYLSLALRTRRRAEHLERL